MSVKINIPGKVTRGPNGKLRYLSRFIVTPKPRDPNKLSEREAKALSAIFAATCGEAGYGVFFRGITKRTKMTKAQVRRSVRALARKGFVEYIRGLFNDDDGLLCGSGYGLTAAGIVRAKALAK